MPITTNSSMSVNARRRAPRLQSRCPTANARIARFVVFNPGSQPPRRTGREHRARHNPRGHPLGHHWRRMISGNSWTRVATAAVPRSHLLSTLALVGLLTSEPRIPGLLAAGRTAPALGNGLGKGFANDTRSQRRGRPGFAPEFPVRRAFPREKPDHQRTHVPNLVRLRGNVNRAGLGANRGQSGPRPVASPAVARAGRRAVGRRRAEPL